MGALVSVVLPTYDRPHYLRGALESALAQTYEEIEVLVCDDAASPENRAIVESFDDSRVKYRKNDRHLGMGRNKVSGLHSAAGAYVANLDDDDLWEPDFLAKLVPLLEADETLALAFSDHHVIDERGRIDPVATEETERRFRGRLEPGKHQRFCRAGLVDRSVPMSVATVVRQPMLRWEDFPPAADRTTDLWLTYLACKSGGGAYYLKERLARYRSHSSSATVSQGLSGHLSNAACYERFLQDEALEPLHKAFQRECSLAYGSMALEHLSAGDSTGARKSVKVALARRITPRALAIAAFALLPNPLARRLLERLRPGSRTIRDGV
jgi:hypothetical protein